MSLLIQGLNQMRGLILMRRINLTLMMILMEMRTCKMRICSLFFGISNSLLIYMCALSMVTFGYE
jgi:hypothetical protein